MTIVEFITARIDEDERTAREAIDDGDWGESWHEDGFDGEPETWCLWGEDGGIAAMPREVAAHAGLHDPARVLRQCATLRNILTLAESAMKAHQADYEPSTMGSDENYGYRMGEAFAYPPVLKAIAAIWSTHPDYQAEWSAVA